MKIFIGIDNGTSGSIGILCGDDASYFKMPKKIEKSYTKKDKNISRISVMKLLAILNPYTQFEALAVLERPMINPGRFAASMSAMRALEATLIVLEQLNIPVIYTDSKAWQKELLPPQDPDKTKRKKGKERTDEIKYQSLCAGFELFPGTIPTINKQGDADGLLIAEWARRNNL